MARCGEKGTRVLLASCSVLNLKRSMDCFVFLVLFLIAITFIYFPARKPRAAREIPEESVYDQVTLSFEDLTDEGFIFTGSRRREGGVKYISYEPPVGSWSKQLLALENAVIFAKLLNRTLLIYPLVSEKEGKRFKVARMQTALQEETHVYDDRIDEIHTVPISSVIDLNILSKLISVQQIRGTPFPRKFLENATWYDVCHKKSLGFWVDFIPSPRNFQAWALLDAQRYVPVPSALPIVEPICDQSLDIMDDAPTPFIRGILSELALVEEDVICFRGGSLATTDIRFLSKERALLAQTWAARYIRFTPYVLGKIRAIVGQMKKPFNALLIPEDQAVIQNAIRFRLREMQKRKFLEVSNRLLVIMKWENSTLLRPLREQGYDAYVPSSILPITPQPHLRHDIANLLGELICKYARLFAGPADSYLIQRARMHEARKKEGLLVDHVTVRWAGHTVARRFRVTDSKMADQAGGTNSTDAAQRIACLYCKFIQRRVKFEMCQPIMQECSKRHIYV